MKGEIKKCTILAYSYVDHINVQIYLQLDSGRITAKDLFTLVELNRRMCLFLAGGSHEDQ